MRRLSQLAIYLPPVQIKSTSQCEKIQSVTTADVSEDLAFSRCCVVQRFTFLQSICLMCFFGTLIHINLQKVVVGPREANKTHQRRCGRLVDVSI